MHRQSAEEFLLTLLEALDGLPPDLASDLAEVVKNEDVDRSQAIRQLFEDSLMTEKLQRLVMRAFRGVPAEMTVDFGKGNSIVVYGDNGTGKSTIADALEWYFTGDIELFRTKDASTPCAMSAATAMTSHRSRSSPTVRLAGRWYSRTSGRRTFRALRRETFLLRGRTLADFINKTKTEKWKALVEILGLDAIESLREDLQRARNELRKSSKAAEDEARAYRRALSWGSRHRHAGNRAWQSSADLRDAGCRAAAIAGSGCRSFVAFSHRGCRRNRFRSRPIVRVF